MIDTSALFRAWLISDAALMALVPADNVRADILPEEANIGSGETWLTFRQLPSEAHTEIGTLYLPSYTVTCWADSLAGARAIYRAIYDLVYSTAKFDGGELGVLLCVEIALAGQDIIDPDTKWFMNVSDFRATMRESA